MSSISPISGLALQDLRLMTKIARLYHEQGVRQPQIAEQLCISQPRVSRLLKKAAEVGIVRTIVVTPAGVFDDLETEVERLYGLREVVIADAGDSVDEAAVVPALGAVTARYLETTLVGGERLGVSSWSSALLATIDAMQPRHTQPVESVVQVLGGLGQPSAQAFATRLVSRLVQLTGARPIYLPAPGLVSNLTTRQALMTDASTQDAFAAYGDLTVLLAGIGSLAPSPLLQASGNAIGEADQDELRAHDAVGDVCMCFFDAQGEAVDTPLAGRVIGIDRDVLRAVPRRIGVAGGARKHQAIRAAILGRWVNVLVTDNETASYLRDNPPG